MNSSLRNATSLPRRSNASRAERHPISRLALTAVAGTLALCTGCSAGNLDAALDSAVKKLFQPRRTPQQYMIVAVSDSDPDVRRDAIARVADSRAYDSEWAIKGFVTIARFESDAQTRCVAVRALGRTGDPRAVETALMILNHRDYPPEEVHPPDVLCRWDGAVVLADLSAAGKIPDEHREATRNTLSDRLRNDTDRHVRAAAARGLGCFSEPEVVRILIDALRDRDFAVVHECEMALVRLTGVTHDCDLVAWNAWYEQNSGNLFARAGEIPESRRPHYRNRFEKAGYEIKEFVRWVVPARKD